MSLWLIISRGDEYEHVCTNPKLQPLIHHAMHYSNQWVRCNETREFNFACGLDGNWFEPKVVASLDCGDRKRSGVHGDC